MMAVLHSAVVLVPAAFVAGLGLGLVHFATLKIVLARYAQGRLALGAVLHVVRLVVIGAVMYGLARAGVAPLLAGVLGLFLSRMILLVRAL